jgi:hypothetical protein
MPAASDEGNSLVYYAQAKQARIEDFGSAAFTVDPGSAMHESSIEPMGGAIAVIETHLSKRMIGCKSFRCH